MEHVQRGASKRQAGGVCLHDTGRRGSLADRHGRLARFPWLGDGYAGDHRFELVGLMYQTAL
jgi:hypothetical protein